MGTYGNANYIKSNNNHTYIHFTKEIIIILNSAQFYKILTLHMKEIWMISTVANDQIEIKLYPLFYILYTMGLFTNPSL